ncbi:uncharacterized protein LOC129567687 isoform X2 [Sitodiplosis mosellana]|uniref:uncharacterized protein LOC129567687 isoform X2 n=1 Tax=Sitodiplosis mosellana TaxID=263140 RepID=UPI002444355C|nr:uncharacterized protein LOC129567687 isoform X2 [Sitodiplosis mosellana]
MPSIGVNLRVTGHCSQGGRKYMEDFFSVAYQQGLADERDFEYAFIGIYDGHGGAEAATFAKEHLINLIVNQKAFWSDDDHDVLRAIREGYIATHYAMWREQEKWPKTASGLPSTAGTTASVAFIRHGKIYIGHVGDSGIVLGYQEDGEKHWRAQALTQDHKPESHEEQTRIINSGGKVINKAGVPRVVWNRPRIGHKGPVRRSTPIDEIPFLAVARSLGDLWSYNSALNEFVVSPEPDVRVVRIDPKRFKCLVFGTDGLWNVVSPQGAVDNVRLSDQMNERSACNAESREWINPSKNLVDKALERWSTKKMRADNTSVVIIMFDPPGPPKRDLLKSPASRSHLLGYLPDSQPSQHLEIEPVQNFGMYDHSTNELMDIDGIPLPTSGATVLTRYENITESDVQTHNQQQAFANATDEDSFNGNEEPYMNSFAESYNSLLNSSLNEDHSYVYNNEASEDSDFDDSNSYDNPNTTHQYMDRSHEHTPIYSLHKLQTRSEQQYNAYASTSSSPMPSTSHAMYGSYQHNLVDHNYLGDRSQYPSTSSGYRGRHVETELNRNEEDERTLLPLSSKSQSVDVAKSTSYAAKECIASTSKGVTSEELNESSIIDDSIQINEISSSDNNDSTSSLREPSPRLKKLAANLKKATMVLQQPTTGRKVTRSSLASSVRVTRSAGTEKRAQPSLARSLKPKVAIIIQKPSANVTIGRVHKENISILRKVPVKALVDSAIVTPSRTRSSEAPQQDTKLLNQRTLRSQNALTKNTASKTIYRPTQNQTTAVSSFIQKIGRVVTQAKVYPVSTRANNNTTRTNNNNNNTANTKNLTCKKQPKRLIHAESVQIVKSSSSCKLQKSTEPLAQARTSTLRFKVVVAKKSVVEQLRSCSTRASVITRRMRLQQ